MKLKHQQTIPPHVNFEVHKRIMAMLDSMTSEEIFQTAVRSGIYTKDGKLTSLYTPKPDDNDEIA